MGIHTTVTLKRGTNSLGGGLPVQIDNVNMPWNMEDQGLVPTDWFDIYSIGWVTPVPQRSDYLIDEVSGIQYSVFGRPAPFFDHLEVRCSVPSGSVP